ncbi:MAG: OmpA family protein [Alphaproteobacteria bacterium]|nr:OmpA family protein [Alphaproteobacteria bacterium]
MNMRLLTASYISLALFAAVSPTQAQTGGQDGRFVVAQAEETTQGTDRIAIIQQFLSNSRPVAKMPDARLAQRLKRARNLSKTKGLSAELRDGLAQEIARLEDEIARRESTSGASQASTPQSPPAETMAPEAQPETQTKAQKTVPSATNAVPDDVAVFLQDKRPLSELSVQELRKRMRTARQLAQGGGINKQTRKQLQDVVRAARAELDVRNGGQQAPGSETTSPPEEQTTQNPPAKQGQPVQGQPEQVGNGDPEGAARALIASSASARNKSNAEIRKRLQEMRDLLAFGKLSPQTRKALRQTLAEERSIVRSRMGQTANGEQPGGNNNNTQTVNSQNINIILKDRRPSRDLRDDELRRRIRILREAQRDARYDEQERRYWRDMVELDRRDLNQRLLEQRNRRREDLRIGVNSGKFNFDLGMRFRPDRRPPPYVFAAEANEDDLEEILAAPPRREINRRYTADEVSETPELRDAVARIEIDTVKFGFGEGFLREEEIENLDRIAEIIERILAAHPGEVFMIEGHTDAVGSDAANLSLSRERALAVKKALVSYFVIPPENLKTVGLGERFLKIPTEEAEAENRRVSIARITPLVGELDQ